MQSMKKEISKAEYLRYISNSAAYRREREKTIPQCWAVGYGWYGVECVKSNDMYFRIDHIGNSCD